MTATRMLPARLMAAGLLVAAGLAPAVHASPRARGWVISRTSAAARPIEGHLDARGVSEEAAVFMFALTGQGARRRVDYRFVTTTAEWGVDGWAQARTDAVSAPACPAACALPVGVPQGLFVTSNERALASTVYVAAYDVTDPVLTISSPGWVVRPWQPSMRSLTTATAEGSGVSAAHESVGTFRGGRLDGGRYGSVVSAALPCDNAGDGSGTLTGAGRTWGMHCGHAMHAVDGAPGRARWSLAAEVTGSGSVTAVLIVVDWPRS